MKALHTDEDVTVVETHDAITTLVCFDCGAPVIKGGPIVPGAHGIAHASDGRCVAGKNWAWCHIKRRFSEWLPEEGA